MSLRADVLAAILAMALATLLCRAGGYLLLRRGKKNAAMVKVAS